MDTYAAVSVLRRVAKDYELQAEAARERENLGAEIKAADNLAIALALNEVAAALEAAA